MRKQIKFFALTALFSLPISLAAADSSAWYNPKNWFNKDKKTTSTTVTGAVESVGEQVVFKTVDGQTLVLTGKKASKVGDCSNAAKIRVFGNVCKPSDKYPSGALQVRNYRVLEEKTPIVATEDKAYSAKTDVEPEPYEEPVLETSHTTAPEVAEVVETAEDTDDDDDVVVEMVDESKVKAEKNSAKAGRTYVVKSGDTLGKISSNVFGTTTKWKKIAEANNITNPRHLKVGMTLNIPE